MAALLERQTRELEEASDERAAIAEVLGIVISSPNDAQPCSKASPEQALQPWWSKAKPMTFLGLRCMQSGLRSGIFPHRPDDRSEP